MTEISPAQAQVLARLYPETLAGGYSRDDGTIEFFTRINTLLRPDMRVVDYGAGRGEWLRDPVVYRRDLRILRGKVREVVGVDIDTAVQMNPTLDRSVVCDDPRIIPLPTDSVDMIVSDHTFEHIEFPADTTREMARVLKSGGWICARTPNRFGYIALAASLVPNSKHASALRRLQPRRDSVDVFPTRYRLNSTHAIHRHFPSDRFVHHTYFWAGDPGYFGKSILLARLQRIAAHALPGPLRPKMLVFLQKR